MTHTAVGRAAGTGGQHQRGLLDQEGRKMEDGGPIADADAAGSCESNTITNLISMHSAQTSRTLVEDTTCPFLVRVSWVQMIPPPPYGSIDGSSGC